MTDSGDDFPMNGVCRSMRRADRPVVDGLATYGVATIHEAQRRIGLLAPYVLPTY